MRFSWSNHDHHFNLFMLTVTNALITRLARMPLAIQKQMLEENPGTNYAAMVSKCTEMSGIMQSEGNDDIAEKIDDLRFVANLFLIDQKHPGAII